MDKILNLFARGCPSDSFWVNTNILFYVYCLISVILILLSIPIYSLILWFKDLVFWYKLPNRSTEFLNTMVTNFENAFGEEFCSWDLSKVDKKYRKHQKCLIRVKQILKDRGDKNNSEGSGSC